MKKLALSILLLMAILTLPLFAIPIARAPTTDLTHLVVDRIGEPQDLDPAWAYDTLSSELLMNVYDSLLWFNQTDVTTYIPRLATSWYFDEIDETSPEGVHWVSRLTFVIRNGVYFQSDGINDIPGEGALLTTQDAEYTFERLLITDAAAGTARMIWEPLLCTDGSAGLNATLTDLGWPVNSTTGWNTKMDEAIDEAVQSNSTHVWFNLIMPYEPILQILVQSLGSIVNKAWCVWHGDWPGMSTGDDWYLWHDPATSPLYNTNPASPGPHLDCALGTGPYMLDYWNKGAGGAWSIIKNPNYWEGWTVPFRHEGWGAGEPTINGHVDRYTSNYIPLWVTRKLRFLSGVSDFCDVPASNIKEVLGQPGIRCVSPLPQLAADACFFNFAVSTSSTHMGVMQAPGTFSQYGAPPNIMEDLDFRRALTHMFDYATYLQDAFLNESMSPVTPIIPGISYYDPSIGQIESPTINQRKKYGIAGEPAGQLAYDLDLAKTYLQAAWGGQLWANGFTFDAVYIAGSSPRPTVAHAMKNAFDTINAMYGRKFTINLVSITLNSYMSEWKARKLPYFVLGWLADYPDAHDFAFPFMHGNGAFAQYQGYLGVTSFPNQAVDDHINAGIYTTVPSERQGNYTWLQDYYVNNALGFVTSQPTGRHFERDWVQGWYHRPMYPCNYVYDLWKATEAPVESVEVGITVFSTVNKLELGFPIPNNPSIMPFPSPIEVVVVRNDGNPDEPSIEVIFNIGLKNATWEIILDTQLANLNTFPGPGSSFIAEYYALTNTGATIVPGLYSIFANVTVASTSAAWAQDTYLINNEALQASPVTASIMIVGGFPCDVNVDGVADMADISICIDAFMSVPFPLPSWNWDIRCDLNSDNSVDMADVALLITAFMSSFDP